MADPWIIEPPRDPEREQWRAKVAAERAASRDRYRFGIIAKRNTSTDKI